MNERRETQRSSPAEQVFERLGTPLESQAFLAHGNHNENHLVETSAGKRVLRVESGAMFHNLQREYETLESLPPGLGPKVFAFDGSHELMDHDYLVEEFLEGEHPKAATPEFIRDMANWFRKLHEVKRPLAEPFRPSAELAPYRDNFDKYRAHLPPEKAAEVETLLERARATLENLDPLFAADREESLCHNDASAGNIMAGPDGLRLIDWEFAGYGLPERELVYFMRSFDLDADQREELLKQYGYPESPECRRRLDAIRLLNTCADVGYSLWRLDLMAKGEVPTAEELATRERLSADVAMLGDLLVENKNS